MHIEVIKGMALKDGAKAIMCSEGAIHNITLQTHAVVVLFIGKAKIYLCKQHLEQLNADIQEAMVRISNGT